MGPALATQHATDGLVWAQPLAPKCATEGLVWAQCWPLSMLPMILHGPGPGHPECYRCSCMGPALATQNAMNGLAWAQPWSPRMLPTVLHGPSAAPHSMLPMFLHGPSTGHPAYY